MTAPSVRTDWVIVMAGHIPDADGTSATAYNRLVRDNQPPHNTLGLLTYELEQARAHLTRAHD